MAAINFPFEFTPMQPPRADANTCDLCSWVFSNWRTWTRRDGPGERPLDTNELIAVRAAVERYAWHGARIH
jgi:hypothetical protein